jgi:hypothetical protein
MRGRRAALTILAALAILAVLGAWLALGTPLFDSPERRVARYLDATGRGDGTAAMDQWSVYVSERDARFHAPDQLVERRRALTLELASNRVGRGYTVTSTEWWATCCTPRPIDDPRNAGLARVHVTTTGENGKTYKLIFEVWVKDLTYWGDAAGERFQDWRLYEVHEEDQPCVFPNPDFGCIRALG